MDILHETPSPSKEPVAFTQMVAKIVNKRQIDLIVPTFEEGFFLSRYAELLPVQLFAPPFEVIEQLHSKYRFAQLCRELGISIPETHIVSSQNEMREQIAKLEKYVARPAFSRGGLEFLTNFGPRTGEFSVDDCTPTLDNPWLVQPYVEGEDACSFSIVQEGKIRVHCAYKPTVPSQGGWAVQFTSVDDFGSFDIASKIAKKFKITGFISFDYRQTKDGLMAIECNPRLSAGGFLTPQDWIAESILNPNLSSKTQFVPAGRAAQYDSYLIDRHIVKIPPRKLLHELLTKPDVLMKPSDVLPGIYFFLTRRHFSSVAKKDHVTFCHALYEDNVWDGTPLADLEIRTGNNN
ncbi:MAG: ATP-grasp domain-containing protein [Cyanobacteria bacterium P01_H01_bin.15]